MKIPILLCLPISLLTFASCNQKQPNPVGEVIVKEVIENSPGANHLVGGIVRAVDCGLGGLAEGVFKEGTIRLEELQQELAHTREYISSHTEDDDWFVPDWMPFTNDRKLNTMIGRVEELERLIIEQGEQVQKMKKCWEGMKVFDSEKSTQQSEEERWKRQLEIREAEQIKEKGYSDGF